MEKLAQIIVCMLFSSAAFLGIVPGDVFHFQTFTSPDGQRGSSEH